MVNGSSVMPDKYVGALQVVWEVLPEASIAVEECPVRPQPNVHGRLERIWAAITNNPIWIWKPVPGTLRLIVLYDAEVSGTVYGDAEDVIRHRLKHAMPATVRVEVEYHQIYRANG